MTQPTWEEYETQRGRRRPPDWQERPEGPDPLDLWLADANALGGSISRREVLAAMEPVWERCTGPCGREYRYPHLCRAHMLCGLCHPREKAGQG